MQPHIARGDARPQVQRTSRRPRLLLVVAGLATTAAAVGVTAGPGPASGSTTVAPEPTAWILDSPGGSASLEGINVSTNAVVATIPIPKSIAKNLGVTAGALAITPNGKTAYLAVQFAREVVPIDLSSQIIGKAIKVANQPVSIAINPKGSRAYVLGYVNVEHASVVAINTSTGSTAKEILVGPLESAGAGGIAITPNGSTVWTSSSENGTVTSISTTTGKTGKPITVGAFPTALAITPNGKTLWVANSLDYDLVPVALANSKVGSKVRLSGSPDDLSITPNGAYAFASFGSPANGGVRVTLSGSHPATKIKLEDATKTALQVDAVAVDPAGGTAFFCGASESTVAPANVASAKATTPITLHAGVAGVSAIAITPDQAPTAKFTVAVSGRSVSLDAASSSARFGTIAHYAWTFGDEKSSSHGPTTSHTYSKNGKYTITLVVTDSLGTSTTIVFTGQTVSRNGGPKAKKSTGVDIR